MYLVVVFDRSFVSLHIYVRSTNRRNDRTPHSPRSAHRGQMPEVLQYIPVFQPVKTGPYVISTVSIAESKQHVTTRISGTVPCIYRSWNVNDRRRTAGHPPTISFRSVDHRCFSRFWLWEDLRPTKPRLVVPVKRTEETNNEREFGIAQNSQGIS